MQYSHRDRRRLRRGGALIAYLTMTHSRKFSTTIERKTSSNKRWMRGGKTTTCSTRSRYIVTCFDRCAHDANLIERGRLASQCGLRKNGWWHSEFNQNIEGFQRGMQRGWIPNFRENQNAISQMLQSSNLLPLLSRSNYNKGGQLDSRHAYVRA